MFKVEAGVIVPNSYCVNPNHVLWSDDGFFRLPPDLHQRLIDAIRRSES